MQDNGSIDIFEEKVPVEDNWTKECRRQEEIRQIDSIVGTTLAKARDRIVDEWEGCTADGLVSIDPMLVLPCETETRRDNRGCVYPDGGYYEPKTNRFMRFITTGEE